MVFRSVREETKQNVRRLQSHPSIAVWAANNENEAALQQNWYGTIFEHERFANEYRELYIGVLKDEIFTNDQSRESLSSSPSNGKKTVTENWLSANPQDWHFGDSKPTKRVRKNVIGKLSINDYFIFQFIIITTEQTVGIQIFIQNLDLPPNTVSKVIQHGLVGIQL